MKRQNRIILTLVTLVLAVAVCPMGVNSALAAKKELRFAMVQEPPVLDSTKPADSESGFVLGHIFEGLTRYNKKNKIVAGIATKWKITNDGATFNLRKNAKWSDGKPVTAHDFVHAWRLVVDPKNASGYAFLLYPIKNAEKIVQKKAKVQDLGVKAVDDYTLKVTFERPCAYFDSLVAFQTYFPIRQDIKKKWGSKYAADADKMVFNGPFQLTKWVHGASLELVKNPNYWAKNKIKLDKISIPYITSDDTARFNLFKDKKIDMVSLTKDTLVNAQKERLRLKKFPDGSLFFLEFNHEKGRPTANKNLRLAIRHTINLKDYLRRVIAIPGTKAGLGLIPRYMPGYKKKFRREHRIAAHKPNLKKAKAYMAQACKEIKCPVNIHWLTGDAPISARESEYFQGILKKHLGINLKIDRQIFKQRLAKMRTRDFDIVSAGWGPDFMDPMTFADLFASWNENNHGRWKNAQYDKYIDVARNTVNQKVRMKAMGDAEKILMSEVGIIPLYERVKMFTINPGLNGFVRRVIGADPDFTRSALR